MGKGIVSLRENPLLGPSPETLRIMGGLNTYAVRHGEWWRLIWAPFLHAGWFHILMNFALWYQLGVMIEPDWGFFRTGLVFMISALSGTGVEALNVLSGFGNTHSNIYISLFVSRDIDVCHVISAD